MTDTKVAAFFRSASKDDNEARWVWEKGQGDNRFITEADLVAAVTYLRKQVRSPLQLTYISQLYLPLYIIHVKADRSLLISGVGRPSVTLKNVTVLPPEALQDILGQVNEVKQVPILIENLEKLVKHLHPICITINNVLKPVMIEPLGRLIEPSLTIPSENECITSALSDEDISNIGLAFNTEITRLELGREHLIQIMRSIDHYIEVQLKYINEQRLKIHEDAAAELGMAQLLSHLEEILKYATQQCREFIHQMDASPTKADLIFEEVPGDLIKPQKIAQEFRHSIRQTSIELDVASTQLEEAERRWLSIYEQEKMGLANQQVLQNPQEQPSALLTQRVPASGAESQLSTFISLRKQILGSFPKLQQTIHNMTSQLEQQYKRIIALSVKGDDLRDNQTLMRILVPVFIVKARNPARYGIIPPLRFLPPASARHWRRSRSVPPVKAFNVELFDEVFCDQIQELLRTDMRWNSEFRDRIDQQALQNNWLTRPKRVERFLEGIRRLSIHGFISKQLTDDITNFWIHSK